MRWLRFIILLLCIVCVHWELYADWIENASFEKVSSVDCPTDWKISLHGGAQTSFSVVADPKAPEGRNVLLIQSSSPYDKNVFAVISTGIKGVRPGMRGDILLDVRGNEGAFFSLICGAWSQRYFMRDLGEAYKTYRFPFEVADKDIDENGLYQLRLCLQSRSSGIRVDNLRFEPELELVKKSDYLKSSVFPVRELSSSWKDLKSIPADVVSLPCGDQARLAILSDKGSPVFLFEVNSRSEPQGISGPSMYTADSVQLRLDPAFEFHHEAKASDREAAFAPVPDGTVANWCWQLKRSLNENEASAFYIKSKDGYFMAVRMNESFLGESRKGLFSFNCVVNRSSEGVRIFDALAPGIADGKSSSHNIAALYDNGALTAIPVLKKQNGYSDDDLRGELYILNLTMKDNWALRAQISDSQGEIHKIDLLKASPVDSSDIIRCRFKIPLKSLIPGALKLDFYADDRLLCSTDTEKADGLEEIQLKLKAAESAFNRLNLADKQKNSSYSLLYRSILSRQLELLKRDLSGNISGDALHFYLMRGALVLDEISILLKEYEKFITNKTPLPFALGDDKFFYVGYGHFYESAVRELEQFPSFAADITQIDIEPSAFFPNERNLGEPDLSSFEKLVSTALKKGKASGVKVCLLLNPHYVPRWWKNKHPELINPDPKSPFEPFKDWNHPEVKKLIEAYLKTILSLLASHPDRAALHSLCLTNETVYRCPKWTDPAVRQRFIAALEKRYESIEHFNNASGEKFADFSEIAGLDLSKKSIKFEFYRWKREELVEFHKWMTGIVKTYCPELPLSSKIMVFCAMRPSRLEDSVDIELFSEISDLNGNDNYMIYKEGEYISDWLKVSMYHDMQYSFKPVPVLNSENHVITDLDYSPVPMEHFYTNIIAQALHKTGGVISWVWMDINYKLHAEKSSRDANMYHRPAAIAGQGLAALDVKRLAGDFKFFREASPDVYIFYSPSSFIQCGNEYMTHLERIYEYLSFAGYSCAFLSERQFASGKNPSSGILIMPNVEYLDSAALPGLEKFQKTGGKILVFGEAPRFNSHGKPLPFSFTYSSIGGNELDAERLQKKLEIRLPVKLISSAAEGNKGIVWHAVQAGRNRWLLSVINYNHKPVTVTLKTMGTDMKSFRDMLSGKDFDRSFELRPLKPLILEIK